ncbi:GDIR1 inhibitor, partial [Smithornis capensis]|nr:GDIR1 inhibitor [Smithornis capensis]
DIMADKERVTLSLEEEDEDADVALAYKTPEKKSLREIQELDPGDESLRKYKQALLGAIPAAVGKAGGCSEGCGSRHSGTTIARHRGRGCGLSGCGELGNAQHTWGIPSTEGTARGCCLCPPTCAETPASPAGRVPVPGDPVDRDVFMVGSYAPRAEEYEVVTPAEEAPQGWLARGSYRVRSLVTDDDKMEHLSWEWGLCIKKDWED